MIKVVIVEDNKIALKSLSEKLSLYPDISITATAENGNAGTEKIEQNSGTELIFMDIEMPVMNGIDATFVIKQKYPEIKIVMITVYDDDDHSTSAPVSVKDISASSTNTGLTTIMTYKANEKYLYFTTYTYLTSAKGINELWRTDGTESGTVKIKSFEGAPVNFFNIKTVEYSVKSNVAAKKFY